MEFVFASYDKFLEEYKTYRFDECGKWNGIDLSGMYQYD